MNRIKILFIAAVLAVSALAYAQDNSQVDLKIYFCPKGLGNGNIMVIYDNDDAEFTEKLVGKLEKSRKSYLHWYFRCKDRLEEGSYIIMLSKNGNVYKYEVHERDFVYYATKDVYIKYDFLADLYEYLARKWLNKLTEGLEFKE